MGRIRESKIIDVPRWIGRVWEFLFPFEVRYNKPDLPLIEFWRRPKLNNKKGVIVQGAFNQLFRPGLRQDFEDEYERNFIEQRSGVSEYITGVGSNVQSHKEP